MLSLFLNISLSIQCLFLCTVQLLLLKADCQSFILLRVFSSFPTSCPGNLFALTSFLSSKRHHCLLARTAAALLDLVCSLASPPTLSTLDQLDTGGAASNSGVQPSLLSPPHTLGRILTRQNTTRVQQNRLKIPNKRLATFFSGNMPLRFLD